MKGALYTLNLSVFSRNVSSGKRYNTIESPYLDSFL